MFKSRVQISRFKTNQRHKPSLLIYTVFLFHLFVTISGAEQQSTGLYYEYQDYPQDQFNNVLVDNQSGLNERNGSDLQEYQDTQDIQGYQDTQDIQGYQDTPENESLEKTEEETISPQYIPDSLQTANEFSLTLNGMMSALSELQRRGESMVVGVREQSEKLQKIKSEVFELEEDKNALKGYIVDLGQERSVLSSDVLKLNSMKRDLSFSITQLQEEKKELSSSVSQLLEQKKELSSSVSQLLKEKKSVLDLVETEKLHSTRMKNELAPLSTEVTQRRTELVSIQSDIQVAKQELEKLQKSVLLHSQQAVSSASEKVGDVTVSVPGASSSNESVLSILLAISVIGNIILGAPFIAGVVKQIPARENPNRIQFPPPSFLGGAPKPKENLIQLVEKKSKKTPEVTPEATGFSPSFNSGGFGEFSQDVGGFIFDKNGLDSDKNEFGSNKNGFGSDKNGFGSDKNGFNSKNGYSSDKNESNSDKDGFGTKNKIGFNKQAALSNLKYVSDRLRKFEKRFKNQYVQDVYYDLPKSF